MQKNYGLTADQIDQLAHLPEEYLLDCMINGKQPDLKWIGNFTPWEKHTKNIKKNIIIQQRVIKNATLTSFNETLTASLRNSPLTSDLFAMCLRQKYY